MRSFFKLTKFGIAAFVVITGLAGYAASLPLGHELDLLEPLLLLFGLYWVSSGSFALNQAQEWRLDVKMERTAKRPIPSGLISVWQAATLGVVMCVAGLAALYMLKPITGMLALLTIILYNGLYTLFWKKKWSFAAVPGALPGAMPVLIGYSVHSSTIWTSESIYLFLIMFLWQMPHFWALAVRYKDDYAKGGFPVLPLKIGESRTLYHIGLYTFAYVGVALSAPLFVSTHILYLLLVIPLSLKVLWEFFRYYHSEKHKRWLPFFLWVNFSMLAFVCAPVADRWMLYLFYS